MTSETTLQNELRVLASRNGGCLWRNNTGVLNDDRGVPVRFGLANDSAKQNKHMKSSDLIGFMPMLVGPEHVGTYLAVFTAVEVKRTGWKRTSNDREVAQLRFIEFINSHYGRAGFAQSIDDGRQIFGL